MKLNLNATVRVILTPYGVLKYKEYWNECQEGRKEFVYPGLRDNILETELYYFMFVLGQYIHPGMEPVCFDDIKLLL